MTTGRFRRSVSGFTMIEALVAVALMAVVLGALATVTAQWMPNWNRGVSRVQRQELLDIALERLVADLSAAEFVSPRRGTTRPLFDGAELSVILVRSAIGPNARPGLEVIRVAETADRQGPILVRSRAPFAPGEASIDRLLFADPVVLLRAPYRVSFSYAGKDRAWKNTWREAPRLPSAVRLIVRDGVSEQTLSVSTAAMIHTEVPADCARAKAERDCDKVLSGTASANLETKPGGDNPPVSR